MIAGAYRLVHAPRSGATPVATVLITEVYAWILQQGVH